MILHKISIQFLLLLIVSSVLCGCKKKENRNSIVNHSNYRMIYDTISIQEFTDDEYPDNPDIAIRSKESGKYSHSTLEIAHNVLDKYYKTFNLILASGNDISSEIIIKDVNIRPFIPYAPTWVLEDDFLKKITLINQEWNRQQVIFRKNKDQFEVVGKGFEQENLVRVDIARNCLNSLLWEVNLYHEIDGKEVVFYHGWFTFPKALYAKLFEDKNGVPFKRYSKYLMEWKSFADYKSDSTIKVQKINFDLIRSVLSEREVSFKSYNDKLYPLLGERKKKQKNIIYPKNATKIRDFLTDSTRYATFSPPGIYVTSPGHDAYAPRPTKLSLLYRLGNIHRSKVVSRNINQDTTIELRMAYYTKEGNRSVDFVVGGIDLDKIPILSHDMMHKGWQGSMGIGTHKFYSTYQETIETFSEFNPYYSFLVDQEGLYMDSHGIGVDGSLMFRQKGKPEILHVYILSFERHSFVGHFSIDLEK